jgi:NAD(P)-dependent dehydrogenase (short-subunit alcohol dehydrogenase family)
MASELPLGRVADPDEIASAALFLAFDQVIAISFLNFFQY